MIVDIHTHTPSPDAIVNFDPADSDARFEPGLLYSVGIHPWRAAEATPETLDRLCCLAMSGQTVAIGESGIDLLRGPDIDIQDRLFRIHVALAEKLGLPLIIHCVRAWDRILRLKKELTPTVPWIIHGFRGKGALARQLIDAGFYLSFGAHYNPEALAATPHDRILIESDESSLPDIPTPADTIIRLFKLPQSVMKSK